LQQKSYLVLEAQNATEASEIVISHSRQIHVLLADDSGDSRAMATTLKPYRPDMRVIHIDPRLHVDSILMEISTVLDPPPKRKKKRKK
jgi:hypothetical protein